MMNRGFNVRSDIEIYLNVSPFVDSAFAALAVHVSLCIGAGHFEAGVLPVITLFLPSLIAA